MSETPKPAPREPIRIVVPWDVSRTSFNRRLHWAARARLTAQAREAATWAWRLAGSPTLEGPATVTLTVRRRRRLDAENALAGAKGCTDALCNRKRTGLGVLMDDGPDWLEWSAIRQEAGKQWQARPEVEYCFTPREEES